MNEPTIDEQVAILTERRENALMIAKNKTGEDRANWLQDAAEYAIVIKSLERLKRLDAQPVPVEPEPLDVPYTQDELLRDRQRWIDYGRILQSALQRAQEERTEATAYGNKAVREISALAALLHWPYCWDTAAYPDLDSCIKEIFKCSTCEEIMIRSMGGSE